MENAPDEEGVPWEVKANDATWLLAKELANLAKNTPYENFSALDYIVMSLMTEFFDYGFSQSEISSAFEKALADMPRYAAGKERHGGG